MNTAELGFLSFSATKCRDEVGRIVLLAKVHGGGYLYVSTSQNRPCITLAQHMGGKYALVTVYLNGAAVAFVAKVKRRGRSSIAVAIPHKFRALFTRGVVVDVRLRPINNGDGR